MSRKSGKIAGEVSTSSGSTNTTTIWLLWSLACVAPSSSLSPTRSQSTDQELGATATTRNLQMGSGSGRELNRSLRRERNRLRRRLYRTGRRCDFIEGWRENGFVGGEGFRK
ncbi:unnamed protein product [Linum trigynum]|uniref:Secreted protein n=1 Tax=Linum trigynum TaxID=586398 RepID=A0AAV2GHE3_9ROSI